MVKNVPLPVQLYKRTVVVAPVSFCLARLGLYAEVAVGNYNSAERKGSVGRVAYGVSNFVALYGRVNKIIFSVYFAH